MYVHSLLKLKATNTSGYVDKADATKNIIVHVASDKAQGEARVIRVLPRRFSEVYHHVRD